MSHYPVLVLSRTGQSVDELLLPYMENCCEEPPTDFMEFYEDEGCDIACTVACLAMLEIELIKEEKHD